MTAKIKKFSDSDSGSAFSENAVKAAKAQKSIK